MRKSGILHLTWILPLLVLMACTLAFPFALNHLFLKGLKRALPLELDLKIDKSYVGNFRLKSVDFCEQYFTLRIQELAVRYSLPRLLATQKIQLDISGGEITLEPGEGFWTLFRLASASAAKAEATQPVDLKELSFDFLNARVAWRTKREFHFPWGLIRGQDLSILWRGTVTKGKKLDLDIVCLMKPELLQKFPSSMRENLFVTSEGPHQRIDFRAKGSWYHPDISIRSELVKFDLKNVEAKPV